MEKGGGRATYGLGSCARPLSNRLAICFDSLSTNPMDFSLLSAA